MNWLRDILLPIQGSDYAGSHDTFFMFIVWLSIFFFVLIAGLLAFFVWRYRRRGPDDVTPNLSHSFKLEVIWSVIPLILVLIIFVWGFTGYVNATTAPGDALEIQVIGKKWLSQFEYPDGMRTIN
jgi:cytochrome c oxidase subunit 2